MSVSKYRYTPSCDGQPCPGDCDLCGKEDDMDDLISRSAAIDAATFSAAEWDGAFVQDLNVRIREAIKGVLSAQPDLSGYSDKLWKAAYERGKREGKPHWILCSERLPEEDQYNLVTMQHANGEIDVVVARLVKPYSKNVPWEWESDGAEWTWSFGNGFAWMPLPEPYAERRTDD